jgi:hypothetical protein
MNSIATKASLSAPRRRLLEAMQRLNFGRIEGLEIRNGEPVFQPAPRIIQDIKIGGENGPRPELTIEDFVLKGAFVELFDHLSRIGDGTVESVEVKYGMPFKLVVEQRNSNSQSARHQTKTGRKAEVIWVTPRGWRTPRSPRSSSAGAPSGSPPPAKEDG